MKKSDLRNGTIVELRDGDKYILLFDCCNEGHRDDLLISLNNGGYLYFSSYDENLKDCDDEYYDIMKVCQYEYVGDNIRNHIISHNDKWTWIRGESETVKED